jgi:O-antigen ligase
MPDTRPGEGGALASFPWRAVAVRLAIVAIPFWLTVPVVVANVDWPIRAVVALVLAVTLASPGAGLLLIAATAPLAELIGPMIGAGNFRIGESMVMAFLVAWLLRSLPDRRGPGVAAPAAGWLLATTIGASIAGLAWQLGRYPGELATTIDQIGHMYFFVLDRIGFVEGARLLEGLGLAAATVMLFRRSPTLANTLPRALASSAAAAALSSVLLWRGIGTAASLARYKMIGYRVSAHVGDVNAAGSYFVMILCLALGMAMRERGGRRTVWLCLAAASGAGLWFSESRSALGAAGAVVIVGATWMWSGRFNRRSRTALLAGVMLALVAGAAVRARLLQADPGYRGVGFREQFNATSLRMIGARPLFGVGEGQYYRSSPLFLSPQLAFTYGNENAHNFFLQVGGELGLVGLGLFTIWLGAGVVRSAGALALVPRDARLLGAAGGVTAFLLTCLTGHPFLVSEVAYPFWIQFGLMSALAGSAVLNQKPARDREHEPRTRLLLTAAAAAAILIASPVVTARAVAQPPDSQAVDGFYPWETLEDGTRFRWTGAYASLFVPADVKRVEIPIRLPTDGRGIRPMGVEVTTAAVDRGRTMADATWAILSLPLPDAFPPVPFKRIDLKVDRVWQPALYIAGNADMRRVGVQVGEPRLIRE